MIQKMYSIRDSKGDFFGPILLQNTELEAERTFSTLANDPKTSIAQHPEDYDLYYLGEFNNTTGKVNPLDSPHHVIKAINTVRKKPEMLA